MRLDSERAIELEHRREEYAVYMCKVRAETATVKSGQQVVKEMHDGHELPRFVEDRTRVVEGSIE